MNNCVLLFAHCSCFTDLSYQWVSLEMQVFVIHLAFSSCKSCSIILIILYLSWYSFFLWEFNETHTQLWKVHLHNSPFWMTFLHYFNCFHKILSCYIHSLFWLFGPQWAQHWCFQGTSQGLILDALNYLVPTAAFVYLIFIFSCVLCCTSLALKIAWNFVISVSLTFVTVLCQMK